MKMNEQKLYSAMIESYPVLYGVCRSVDDAIALIEGD